MDGSPTHANSLWLDPRCPPSTTPAKEERWPSLFTTPLSPSAHARFFAGQDLAISRRKTSVEEKCQSISRFNADRIEASACPTMVFSTRNNPRTPRMALVFSGRLPQYAIYYKFQSGHGSHALFNLGGGKRQHRRKKLEGCTKYENSIVHSRCLWSLAGATLMLQRRLSSWTR